MKNKIKTFLLTFSFIMITSTNTFADELLPYNVKLEGNANGLVSIPDDSFLECMNMLPGDKASGTINIENNHDKPFDLYLRAERVTPKQEYDLLQKIELTVYYKDELIYAGPVSGEDGMVDNIYLGTFEPTDKANIQAYIELDGPSTGNEYRNKFAQVDWIFTALTEDKLPDNPDTEDRPPSTDDKPPSMEDGPPSTENKPPSTEDGPPITGDKPPSTEDAPQTGDKNITTYLILGGVSIALLCYINKPR